MIDSSAEVANIVSGTLQSPPLIISTEAATKMSRVYDEDDPLNSES